MIIDDARKLVASVEILKSSQKSERLVAEYQIEVNDLAARFAELDNEFSEWARYKSFGLPCETDMEIVRSVRYQVDRVRGEFGKDDKWIILPRGFRVQKRVFMDAISNLAKRLRADRDSAWKRYSEAKVEAVGNTVPAAFERIKRFEKDVAEVRRLEADVRARRSKNPKHEADLKDFNAAVEAYADACGKLVFNDVSPTVQAFIQDATELGGAPYDQLTPEVLKALTELDLLPALRLRLE